MLSCLLSDETLTMESVWSLALVIKAVVVATVDADAECSSVPMLLQQQQFVESVSYLAQQGTDLSRKWLVEDLEVMDIVFSFQLNSQSPLFLTWLKQQPATSSTAKGSNSNRVRRDRMSAFLVVA